MEAFVLVALGGLVVGTIIGMASRRERECKGCQDKETALRMMQGVERNLTREKMQLRRELLWKQSELERRGSVIRESQQDYVQASREAMDIANRANAACAIAVEAGKQWKEQALIARMLFHIWRLPPPAETVKWQTGGIPVGDIEPKIDGICLECGGPKWESGHVLHTRDCELNR